MKENFLAFENKMQNLIKLSLSRIRHYHYFRLDVGFDSIEPAEPLWPPVKKNCVLVKNDLLKDWLNNVHWKTLKANMNKEKTYIILTSNSPSKPKRS